ncbi:hypothetical protein DZK25_09455 [Wenzhouxiangella sp. 15181]|nr:hypothetical protein DZK25_09455 [Wenzhouxiangella sp. 15181]RFP69120.1 hypothetical protein DZK26_04940 [Wenzhouxiangella sp. 15190]
MLDLYPCDFRVHIQRNQNFSVINRQPRDARFFIKTDIFAMQKYFSATVSCKLYNVPRGDQSIIHSPHHCSGKISIISIDG